MKKINLFAATALSVVMATGASAATIGYLSSNFDDNFLTLMREAAKVHTEERGHTFQIEDAREDVGTQLSQVQNFIASGVDALVVTAVSAAATPQMTKMANAAGIPIVYVNRMPSDSASLGGTSTFVGSNETWSGTLAAFELCNLAGGTGTAVMLQGILSNEAAVTRSKDFEEVLGLSMCNGIKLEAVEVGSWQRSKGNDIVSNWLSSGMKIDIVFANNDEMGLGAVQAFKNAGISMDDVLIGSVDATADALASMKAGDLDVTVFQNAAGQATGGIDAAIAAINGESLPNSVTIPFELVTPANMAEYMGAN